MTVSIYMCSADAIVSTSCVVQARLQELYMPCRCDRMHWTSSMRRDIPSSLCSSTHAHTHAHTSSNSVSTAASGCCPLWTSSMRRDISSSTCSSTHARTHIHTHAHTPPQTQCPLQPLVAALCGLHRCAGTCRTWQRQPCQTCAGGSWWTGWRQTRRHPAQPVRVCVCVCLWVCGKGGGGNEGEKERCNPCRQKLFN